MSDVARKHEEAVEALVASPGRVFVLGAEGSGKSSFVRRLALAASASGHPAAVVDADVARPELGPPATVALKVVSPEGGLEPGRPDVLAFVGGTSPRHHMLEIVAATAKLVLRAIEMGARMIVVDTCGLVDGVSGQLLHLAQAELCRPRHIVALARGGELEPVASVLERFLGIEVRMLGVHPGVRPQAIDERVVERQHRLAAFLGPELVRWRVKPTVFVPVLPPIFPLEELDGLLVGVDDGRGDCLGLGILEYREGGLRLLTPVSEGVAALRLGSVRVTPDGKITGRVDLRSMLGTD